MLIASTSDVALVVDRRGVIRDLACGSDDLWPEIGRKWLGRAWSETVTVESRPKVEALLRDAAAKSPPRWSQINHPSREGPDLAIVYSAMQIGREGRVVAIGRDLRTVSMLQQKLMNAEQSLERDYSRLRHAETRYRLLFQVASEAVLVVDATTQRVVEANPAAGLLLGSTPRRLVGRGFPEVLDAESTQSLQTLLAAARTTGHGDDVRVHTADGEREFLVSASLFRQDNSSYFLLRLTRLGENADASAHADQSKLLEIVASSPDALVVTDPEGLILTANRAFLEMAQLASDEQARGESIERWVGRPGVDVSVLIANLRQHGSVRLFTTILRSEHGATEDVEISAVSALDGEQPCFGFTLRNVSRRAIHEPRGVRELPRSVEQFTELVGRVPLKDLVRETTDVIERLCIEAALQLTQDNRALASEMLGLSRQSLYTKLRRFGLENAAAAPAEDESDPPRGKADRRDS
jgi:transcriptional regulator PpsR